MTKELAALVLAIAEVRAALEKLSPDDRLRVFEQIMADYCRECGGPAKHPGGQYCQCWNDE